MKKEYKKLEKYQGLKEDLEGLWKVKGREAVPVVAGVLGAGTPRLGE